MGTQRWGMCHNHHRSVTHMGKTPLGWGKVCFPAFMDLFSSSLFLPLPFIRARQSTATSPCISHGDDCAVCQCIPTSPHFLEATPSRLIDVVHALAYMLQWALRSVGVKSIHSAPRKMAWAYLLAPGWCIAQVWGRCMHRYLAVMYIAIAANVF